MSLLCLWRQQGLQRSGYGLKAALPSEYTLIYLSASLPALAESKYNGQDLSCTRRHTASGRTDSRIGALAIEYKQPSTLRSSKDIEKAVSQISNYLNAISAKLENEAIGFLTDGTKILEVRSLSG